MSSVFAGASEPPRNGGFGRGAISGDSRAQDFSDAPHPVDHEHVDLPPIPHVLESIFSTARKGTRRDGHMRLAACMVNI